MTKTVLLIVVLSAWAGALWAQSDPERVWVLPIEIDSDFGAANGDAVICRFIPVNSLIIGKDWKLINLALVTIADAPGGRPGSPGNPEPVYGPNVFGLGDLTDALFFTRTTRGGLVWGAGVAFGIPIATDSRLGSGKWQAGPAARLGYQAGGWRLGLLAANRWSFAGDANRSEVNQLLMRAVIRRTLGEKWFFVSVPIITANWNAASGQRWLIPLGGGIGKNIGGATMPINLSVQAYANVVKPDGAPDWTLRLGVTFPFKMPQGASN